MALYWEFLFGQLSLRPHRSDTFTPKWVIWCGKEISIHQVAASNIISYIFHPETLGEMIQFDGRTFFEMGWNHQLVQIFVLQNTDVLKSGAA